MRAQAGAVDLTALLDTYYQGRYDEAVAKAAALPELGPLRLQFVQGTPAWINADPANAEKRRAAVAGFVVELAGARLETDWGRLSDLIEWTCAQLLRDERSAHVIRAVVAHGHHRAGRTRARASVAAGPVRAAAASEAAEARAAKGRSAKPTALDARDRTVSRRSAVPARARGGVDVGARCRADAQSAAGG